MKAFLAFPKFWFSGNRFMKSDLGFIKDCLFRIPEADHEKVCDEYDRLFLSKRPPDRQSANRYIYEYAENNGVTSKKAKEIMRDANTQEKAKAMVIKAREAQKAARKKIIT